MFSSPFFCLDIDTISMQQFYITVGVMVAVILIQLLIIIISLRNSHRKSSLFKIDNTHSSNAKTNQAFTP